MNKLMTALILAGSAFAASPAFAEQASPYRQADDTWISLDGTITSVTADAFVLDYGPAVVTVEMDDGDFDADAYLLKTGDKVRVTGLVDDDMFETTKIEASSVYVENAGTYFFSSATDEEDRFVTTVLPVVDAQTYLQGVVSAVDPANSHFVIDTGANDIRVEVDDMAYDPIDDTGLQQVDVGDRVSVAGDMEVDFFSDQTQLSAESVVVLSD
ncbi:NirD/YgiW/YdeI family stress tolerance protein [Luteimonas sp. RD2P54]|uniref:NirD/YgiW/YdeI family stress tolerance protein n=1 Tax=Luteimonas endophytica TaxID=3042023 RepID=A0ABT6JCV5_9GAMM|nr:NirD/YgiW/YdeI family stress tolerance protein [Luteimonas endophytica]MDH5824643.1 NirD/YgiW/YdeI family stress tolerance protein [Luteimonas endophytica]